MFSEAPQVFDKAAGTVAVDTSADTVAGMAVGMFAGTAADTGTADTGTAGIVAADTAAGIDPAWCRSAESVVPGMAVRAARKMLDFLREQQVRQTSSVDLKAVQEKLRSLGRI